MWVFGGGWHHEMPKNSFGCWSRIYFSLDGVEYRAGYKWYGFSKIYKFSNASGFAEKINYEYICDLLDYLESGRVFERLLREV